MSQHASRWSSRSGHDGLPHGRGRAWWPTGADLEAMVGLTGPNVPVGPPAGADLGGPDSTTVLAARLSLLFR